MNALKSFGAVVAGFVAVFLLAVLTDLVLMAVHILPPQDQPALYNDGLYAIIFAYTTAYSALGGYLTAWLAPAKPIQHALVLGVLGMLSSALGAIAMWSKAAGHEWYPIALIIIAIPSCWLGGMLYVKWKAKPVPA